MRTSPTTKWYHASQGEGILFLGHLFTLLIIPDLVLRIQAREERTCRRWAGLHNKGIHTSWYNNLVADEVYGLRHYPESGSNSLFGSRFVDCCTLSFTTQAWWTVELELVKPVTLFWWPSLIEASITTRSQVWPVTFCFLPSASKPEEDLDEEEKKKRKAEALAEHSSNPLLLPSGMLFCAGLALMCYGEGNTMDNDHYFVLPLSIPHGTGHASALEGIMAALDALPEEVTEIYAMVIEAISHTGLFQHLVLLYLTDRKRRTRANSEVFKDCWRSWDQRLRLSGEQPVCLFLSSILHINPNA